jgi:hypothetical protein
MAHFFLSIERGCWMLRQGGSVVATAPLYAPRALRALLAMTVEADGCLDFIAAASIDTPFNGGAPSSFDAWAAIDELTEEVAPETTRVVDPITMVPSEYPTTPIPAPFTSTPPWASNG